LAWITSEEVKQYAQITFKDFKEGIFANEDALDTFITDKIIPPVEGHIEAHCKRDFDVEFPSAIPEAIKEIARTVAVNILKRIKTAPIVKAEDLQATAIDEDEVLSPGVLRRLEPWIKKSIIVKASSYTEIEEESSPC